MTLSDLIDELLRIDMEDPEAGQREVGCEYDQESGKWFVLVYPEDEDGSAEVQHR